MQQYFTDEEIYTGEILDLDEEILHHLLKVLRKDSSYVFRLCDSTGTFYHAHLINKKQCEVLDKLDENNELSCDITCILSLIKNDHFELCIQKLTELGVKRIVPYQAQRSVVRFKDSKKLERIRKIAREAAEQSHRNRIPEICDVALLKDLEKYKSQNNYICYEAEKNIASLDFEGSVTYIIGPEGGFDEKEYEKITEMGYRSIGLGKRILRAETAAIYFTSNIVGKCQ
ncbi:MAG: 16S rRNA (uracil(1498)-N(3))-methyltransferase [Erysipelotrichaceae bacterium]|nr:16S rRNA (uracil(1498)-N(3))-methyltransferase [Erysipelotrichaceae bacterium]